MLRAMVCSLVMVGMCLALASADDKTDKNKTGKDKNQKEAKITKVDPKKGTVTVQMKDANGKETQKTFRLAEDVEYMDSTGKVASIDFFTSGDLVLIVEREGKISKMKKQDRTNKNENEKTNKGKQEPGK